MLFVFNNTMIRKIKILSIALLIFTLNQSSTPVKNVAPAGPNIILIFMDDMGYGDLSCYGALDLHTPNIDRLASEGIRFTNFLSAQAVCSASRAAIPVSYTHLTLPTKRIV